MRKKIKLNGPQIRLVLAGCLCVFVFMATTTPESDDSFCSEHDHGDLLIVNNSSEIIGFKFFGTFGGGVTDVYVVVDANSSFPYYGLRSGLYTYLLFEEIHFETSPGVGDLKSTLKSTGQFEIIPKTSAQVIYP